MKMKANTDDTAHQVEAIGTWDHGVEGVDSLEDGAHKITSMQEFVSCATKATKAIGSGIKKLAEKDILHDRELREKYGDHTEEIVAGEKMAVKAIVHTDSFDAPC
jgi:hypothetical protein